MTEKICVITGATSGIGKAAAAQIAATKVAASLEATSLEAASLVANENYHVIIACRNRERGEFALEEIRKQSKSDSVELMIVDMSLFSSIETFAKRFLAKYKKLDVLIHNAAAFDVSKKVPTYTEEGFETIWATNHLGPVFMTEVLLEPLKASEQGRIITISSKGLVAYPFLKIDLEDPEFRRRQFSVQKTYYQSKLAQVMYTYWLAEELAHTPVTANSIRVTNVKIDIETRYPNASRLSKSMYALKSRFSISPEQMAQTYTYLATSPEVRDVSGKYFDDPTHIVKSSGYSRDKENIAAVMALTQRYIQQARTQERSD